MRPKTRISLILLLAVALTACAGPEGPAGPAGPQGPQGPQGAPGVANRIMLTAIADGTGRAAATLPATITNPISNPPAMSCYISISATFGAWLAVAGSSSSVDPYCALSKSTTTGLWTAATNQMPVGWVAAWVITY